MNFALHSHFVLLITLSLPVQLHSCETVLQAFFVVPKYSYQSFVWRILKLMSSAALSFTSSHCQAELAPPYNANNILILRTTVSPTRCRATSLLIVSSTPQHGRRKRCPTARVNGLYSRLQQQAFQRWRSACPATSPSPSKRIQANGRSSLHQYAACLLMIRRSLHPGVSSSGQQVTDAAAD